MVGDYSNEFRGLRGAGAKATLALVLGHLLPQLDCFSKGAGEAQGLGGG